LLPIWSDSIEGLNASEHASKELRLTTTLWLRRLPRAAVGHFVFY
jgi:hypothetical protein